MPQYQPKSKRKALTRPSEKKITRSDMRDYCLDRVHLLSSSEIAECLVPNSTQLLEIVNGKKQVKGEDAWLFTERRAITYDPATFYTMETLVNHFLNVKSPPLTPLSRLYAAIVSKEERNGLSNSKSKSRIPRRKR
jgi:hypothetical protein